MLDVYMATAKDDPSTPVTRALDEQGIPYRLFRHPGPIHSLEQAAQERGQQPEQVVRSILFRLAEDEFIMVLAAGPRQISWPALRAHLGTSRMTMANEEEVLAVTGYPRGAVSPFGLPAPLRILVDSSVWEPEEVSIGSGVRGLTVILNRDDLRRALGPQIETVDLL
jgi:Cys-tRNA(Pro)/Cys-tRNA(Cys) deacylase